MRRGWSSVGRRLAAAVLALSLAGAGAASPAAAQAEEERVAAVELHHASSFDGAVQCNPHTVRYQPADYWGVLVRDGAQGGMFLVDQCADRTGLLRMTVQDTDSATGRPPGSVRVTITGFLYSGSTSCTTQSVVVDVAPLSGVQFFDQTMTLFGCGTWWRTDMQVWYGTVPPSVFCARPPVMWC